jgi:hypothetical protein
MRSQMQLRSQMVTKGTAPEEAWPHMKKLRTKEMRKVTPG